MGNLNQFYLLGRVSAEPELSANEKGPVVVLRVQPGTGGRAPRGTPALELVAGGPQLEPAKALTEGEAVLLRGQLRQEAAEGEASGRLVAWVQAIEPVLGGEPTSSTSTSARRPRKRRRRPRKEGGGREGGGREGREGQGAPAGEAPPERDPAAGLPPPKPIAEAPAPAPEPDPSFKKDMPF